jgi:hypothetical protein
MPFPAICLVDSRRVGGAQGPHIPEFHSSTYGFDGANGPAAVVLRSPHLSAPPVSTYVLSDGRANAAFRRLA